MVRISPSVRMVAQAVLNLSLVLAVLLAAAANFQG
jgi:hypothetical protein